MTEDNTGTPASVASIVWDNWGIVEILAQERDVLRSSLVDARASAITDEVGAGDTLGAGVVGEVRKRVSGRGVETKYYLVQKRDDAEDGDGERTGIGAIVIDIPKANDGHIHVEVSASLPQQRVFGNSLEDSKGYIRERVTDASRKAASTETMQEVVNIDDLDRATGRNDIAKRVVSASAFKPTLSIEDNIDAFIQDIMPIYKMYTQIPTWLAELDVSHKTTT